MTELEPAAQGERRPVRGRGTRWPWFIVGAVAVVLKAQAWAEVGGHPARLIPVLAVVLAVSVLRPRPVLVALSAAALIALALARHPLLAGLGLGAGVFVVLMVAFFAISTVLHARQRSRSRR